jgi:glycosyltransferase involved in cell wall biosynthesis
VSVSVVLCTWNHARSLARTLTSLAELAPPGCAWELVVVDNGATDDTAAVLHDWRGRLPLRVEREPRLGLAYARNTGMAKASGELVVFTDDDVLVDRAWLAVYVDAARRHPEADYFGGHVEACFEASPPAWLRANQTALRPMLCTVTVREPRAIGATEQPLGPNMAFRRRVLGATRFDERLGRRGEGQVRGSEVAFVEALRRRGARGWWVPEARVQHVVPRAHAGLRYLWRYYEGSGATGVRRGTPDSCRSVTIGFGRNLAATALKRAAGRTDWPVHLARAAYYVGVWRERRRAGGESSP